MDIGLKPVHLKNPQIWFVRVYLYWLQFQGYYDSRRIARRENLCHFVRVIVLWAPITWFFEATLWGKKFLRPVTVAMTVAILGMTILLVSQRETLGDVNWSIFIGLYCYIGLMTGLSILYDGEGSNYQHYEEWWRKLLVLFSPLFMSVVAAIVVAYILWKKIEPHLPYIDWDPVEERLEQALTWIFLNPLVWKVRPWMIFLVAVIALLTVLWPEALLQLGITILAAVVAFVVFVILAVTVLLLWRFVSWIFKTLWRLIFRPGKVEKGTPIREQLGETARVGWAYVVSVKHKLFCPNIVFEFEVSKTIPS